VITLHKWQIVLKWGKRYMNDVLIPVQTLIKKLQDDKKELEKQRDRCLVIATKHCPRDTREWYELINY